MYSAGSVWTGVGAESTWRQKQAKTMSVTTSATTSTTTTTMIEGGTTASVAGEIIVIFSGKLCHALFCLVARALTIAEAEAQ